jgi:serine/threonine protein kinase
MSSITYEVFSRDFEVGNKLGQGTFSTVYRVYHSRDKQYYAYKLT